MSDTALRKIKAVEVKPGYRLAISWQKGRQSIVDLSDMIDQGGVFSELADANKFSAVRIGENNRVIEWPSPADDLGYPVIDIDADALYIKSVNQHQRSIAEAVERMVNSKRAPGKAAGISKY